MLKRLSFISVIVLLLVVILVLAPGSACDQGAKQAEVPAGPPRIVSFKVASENIAPNQAPLFTWEVANAKAVTITQYGVEVYHIEALPDNSGALLPSLHEKVYASTIGENEVHRSYMQGIYPAGFKGGTNGKPSKMVEEPGGKVFLFPENWIEPGSAEITAISRDGQVTTSKAAFNFVAPLGYTVLGSMEPYGKITPPPCVRAGSSTPIIPAIKRWSVKNPVIKDGEAPQFEFEVTNAHIISIRHGDEYISSVEIVNPTVTSSLSLPPFTDEAHASTTSEYEYKQPYSPGIYPAGFNGGTNGHPSKMTWKFGEKSREDSAEITVCSPSGDVAMATVRWTVTAKSAAGSGMDAIMVGTGAQPPVITFTASRNIVGPMDPVTFTYRITGADNAWLISDGSKEAVPMSGSKEIIILKSACYYLTAENPAGRASEQQCITVASSGFIPPPDIDEPPCPPPAPPLAPPPLAPPPVAPITDGH